MRAPSAIHDIGVRARQPYEYDLGNLHFTVKPLPSIPVTPELEDDLIAASRKSRAIWGEALGIVDNHARLLFRLRKKIVRFWRGSTVHEPAAQFDLSAFRPIAASGDEP